MMIFYYLHYFLLGMLVWEIHQVGRRIGAQLLVYIGMLAAAGVVLALGRAQTDSFIWWSWCFGMLLLAGSGFRFCRKGIGGRISDAVLWTDRYSYEIYLVHAVILEGLGMVRVQIGLPNAAFLILALLLTGAGAVLSKKLIEDPIAGLVARSRM